MQENKFVSFLNQFNILSPNHEKIYDEYIFDEQERFKTTFETKVQKHLLKLFRENPGTVILTGNAGDGKTRLCRFIYDNLGNQELQNWNDKGIVEVEFEHGKLRIIKDLSEQKDEIIYDELLKVQEVVRTGNKDRLFFLIAANEGKLTKFLIENKDLEFLRENVRFRLEDFKKNDSSFSVINLIDVTTSAYVKEVLKLWNNKNNWEICGNCPEIERCIIFFNHTKTSKEYIQNRIFENYRILDFLGIHVTIREMLIHLSFLITGGYTCLNIIDADAKEKEEQIKRAYYNNFFGDNINNDNFSEMETINSFRMFDPGNYSNSTIDDFIVNGEICGEKEIEEHHKAIFKEAIDLQFGFFKKTLSEFRDHNLKKDPVWFSKWIKKLRRKFFFEIPEKTGFSRYPLLPFRYLANYIEMFEEKKAKTRRSLINGLNRAFSKKLLDHEISKLLATDEILQVYDEIPSKNVQIIQEEEREDIDRIPSIFLFKVDNVGKHLLLNLLTFEFLMRANAGSVFNLLHEEVNILIDTFKNELKEARVLEEDVLQILQENPESGLFKIEEIDL